MTEQDLNNELVLVNALGFVTHCVASGMTEKQASTLYVKARKKQATLEKLASVILDSLE
jgi:hypothetical protein